MRPATPPAALDDALATLRANAERWARLPLGEKLPYLRAALEGTVRVAERQVRAASAAKGIPPDSPLTGEEWLAGPVAQTRIIRLLLETLEHVARGGEAPVADGELSLRTDGKLSVQVFPAGPIDKLTFGGFTAEVVQAEHINRGNVRQHLAAFYKERAPAGKVALVLGAGNVASIGPLDAVHKLFVEGQVVILKFNPVNEYLGPFFEEAFADLIRDGFVRTAYGDGAVGAHLSEHREVDEIHITGSDRTHDAIVFGTGPEGAARKAADDPRNLRRVTSELGNVSPIIVVPGPWTAKDLRFHATNLASQLANNGGFNCNAARVIITHDAWPQAPAFLDRLRETLARIDQRRAYYPGAEARWAQFVEAHPQAEPIGPRREGVVPWTLIPDLDPENAEEMCFTTESWCGVFGQTALGGADARAFLERAVTFCNERVWGTLNCSILVHPATAAALGDALEQAIDRLRYGTVVINHWAGLGYALGVTPWGAAPGHTRADIRSGIGFVHNTRMFDAPEKTIIRGPFHVWPTPPWFVTHRATHKVARAMLKLEANPGWARLPGVVLAALKA